MFVLKWHPIYFLVYMSRATFVYPSLWLPVCSICFIYRFIHQSICLFPNCPILMCFISPWLSNSPRFINKFDIIVLAATWFEAQAGVILPLLHALINPFAIGGTCRVSHYHVFHFCATLFTGAHFFEEIIWVPVWQVITCLVKCWAKFLTLSQTSTVPRWRLGKDNYFHSALPWACIYSSILWFKLNNVSKRGVWCV